MFAYTNSTSIRLGWLLAILVSLSLILAACTPAAPASQPPGSEADSEKQPPPTEELPVEPSPTRDSERQPEELLDPVRGPITVPETPIVGEVPGDLLDQVYADLEQNQGRSPDNAVLLRAQAVTWPDGSLGCPEPGQMYTMALVDGYWIQIQVGEEIYDYRATERGSFKLCTREVGSPKPPSPGE